MVALSNEVDDTMAKWVGAPCLQTVPGGLPIDVNGKPDINGPFAAHLWSVCNCAATSSMSHFNKGKCEGPLCGMFNRPDLPSLNFAMPNITLADIGPLIDIHSWNFTQVGVLFAPPSFNMPRVSTRHGLGCLDAARLHLWAWSSLRVEPSMCGPGLVCHRVCEHAHIVLVAAPARCCADMFLPPRFPLATPP